MTEREHLELFMYRVTEMRKLQKRYFSGDNSVLKDAKKAEQIVDIAIATLCGSLGYNIREIEKKFSQGRL